MDENILMEKKNRIFPKYLNGVPCNHKGCLNHISHPCDGCGRIAGLKIIKFNNDYPKLASQKTARLINVWQGMLKDFPCELLKYDSLKSDGSYFSFKDYEKSYVYCLLFVGDKNILFTTFRKVNIPNMHYESEEGELFKIYISNDNNEV